MNLIIKLLCSTSILMTILMPNAICQSALHGPDSLILNDRGRIIENYVSINTSYSNYEKIKTIIGQKINITAGLLIVNGDTLDPLSISTRGQSSLNYRRKSFTIDIKSKAAFRHGDRTESLRKFYLISLAMDRNYSSNRLAFEMMEDINLFKLFYSFCELRINNESEGIYMVIERPEDWAMKIKKSPLLIRRGFNHTIDKIKTGIACTDAEARQDRDNFNLIYRLLNKSYGEQLYNDLSDLLDMDAYLRWIAFNFFVKNGDYTDEVFFYIDKDLNKYNIIPWDYDDLFSPAPHEGNVLNRKLRADKMFFSTEDLLDKKIVSDPYLYKQYLIRLRDLLIQLSPDLIKKAFENTYAELFPYYANKEIISKSATDLYSNATLPKLKEELSDLYVKLLIYREVYLKDIDGKLN